MDFLGNISDNGKLIPTYPIELAKWLITNKGKAVTISLKVKRSTRSNPQNRYYWGVIIEMVQYAMNEHGNEYSKEEVHEFLKKEFNSEEREMKEGYYVKVPRSTTSMNTVDFMNYKEKIQQFAAEILGIYIPDPNECFDDSVLIEVKNN